MSSRLKKNIPIKICFIASHFPQGGAERQILELIKGLLQKEYKVTFMLYQSDQIFYEEILELDINLILNKDKPSKNVFFKWINNILFLRKNLKNNSFDILHTYLFHNGLIVRLFAAKKHLGKIIYSIRGPYKSKSVSGLYYYIDKLLNKYSVNVYNSNKSFKQLYYKPSKSILKNNLVIYNGFDTKRFYSSTRTYNKKIIIGMVGRMSIQKNQTQVLRVLKKIKSKSNTLFQLYLIGDNTLSEGLKIKNFIKENNLSENVVLMDAQNNIEEYYRKFDLFVLSSLYEGCPNVLFEAMLSKCICIISEGANSDFFIKDKFNGLVYDGTDEMLEIKIKESFDLLKSNRSNEIIENSYKHSVANFSLDKMINSYDRIYKTALTIKD